MFLEARRGAVLPRRVPSRTRSVVEKCSERRLVEHDDLMKSHTLNRSLTCIMTLAVVLLSLPHQLLHPRSPSEAGTRRTRRAPAKAEVVELKAAIERLTAEVVEPKDEDTKQTKKARPGHTIVVAFTEDEAKEMRDIAEETKRRGKSLVHLSDDISGRCNLWPPTKIAEDMGEDGNQIVTLSSRLLQLCNHKGLLELLSSRGV